MGGVNNPSTLLFGSPDAVAKEVMMALEAGIEIIARVCRRCARPMKI